MINAMRKRMIAFLLVGAQFVLWGCYLEGPDYTEELDIVLTNYDNQYDFVSKGTYSLPDQIVKITGKPSDPPEYVKPIYAGPILTSIQTEMTKLGWTKVDVNANPDVQLMPAVWSTTTVVGGSWGGYYCWWYPYYCSGGWYYPYYVVGSYTTGSMVMTMVDPKLESADGNVRVVWSTAMNGLLSGTYEIDRITAAIQQSFAQSPYLKTN